MTSEATRCTCGRVNVCWIAGGRDVGDDVREAVAADVVIAGPGVGADFAAAGNVVEHELGQRVLLDVGDASGGVIRTRPDGVPGRPSTHAAVIASAIDVLVPAGNSRPYFNVLYSAPDVGLSSISDGMRSESSSRPGRPPAWRARRSCPCSVTSSGGLLLLGRLLDQPHRELGVLPELHRPPDDVAAEDF